MSRQLALGGQPVLVAHWAEALEVAGQHARLNRLLLVEPPLDTEPLLALVREAVRRGCALIVVLGQGAEAVHRAVDAAADQASLPGRVVATSWHDPGSDPRAPVDAFSLFSDWVGGSEGVPLLVTEDVGLDAILDAARVHHARMLQGEL
ncbi:MAG TPA: hypothetical protein VEJ89_16890 [Myxococcaceae bacterium]|jgi:hypothetical protein|nr:hypothetical protein [Myxococcaceae bacterium]